MRKFICGFLVVTMSLLNLFSVSALQAGCESQYCACDGQMHPCDFSLEQCQALCGGGDPAYSTSYRNTDLDALYLGFAVAFVAIGVILYFTGAFNPQQNNSIVKIASF